MARTSEPITAGQLTTVPANQVWPDVSLAGGGKRANRIEVDLGQQGHPLVHRVLLRRERAWPEVRVGHPPLYRLAGGPVLAVGHIPEVDRVRRVGQPGNFFARELPPITAVLADTDRLDLLIIDGYVDLDPGGRPGLGAHLYQQINIPVIGIAKTLFRTATHAVAVRRGTATRPLYVTAAGVAVDAAAELVTQMAGAHRLPDAVRRVDALARANRTAQL
jgi:deoxyribonuclease V